MKLSDLKCRKSTTTDRLIKLSDGDGLFLHVYPNGRRHWRFSYRFGGKQRDLAIGPYPEVSLLEAREIRPSGKTCILASLTAGTLRLMERRCRQLCCLDLGRQRAQRACRKLAQTRRVCECVAVDDEQDRVRQRLGLIDNLGQDRTDDVRCISLMVTGSPLPWPSGRQRGLWL